MKANRYEMTIAITRDALPGQIERLLETMELGVAAKLRELAGELSREIKGSSQQELLLSSIIEAPA